MRKYTVFGITMLLLVSLMSLIPVVKATVYCWDSVRFVSDYYGEWIKYPHPDRVYYGISPYSTQGVDGYQLHHLQINQATSVTIVAATDLLCAFIGAYYGDVAGALVGAALGVVITYVSEEYFLDEYHCIWVWLSLAFIQWLNDNALMLWVMGLTDPAAAITLILCILYASGYIRVGAVTFLDKIGRGDPTPEPNLRVLAQDQYGNSLTNGDVYIDGQWAGFTGQNWLLPMDTTHTIRTNDFWEAGGYRYGFTNWDDGTTSYTRTVTVSEPTTVTAYFFKKLCPGDVHGDGGVDIYDALTVARAFASYPGHPRWDSTADIVTDGIIDIYDAISLAGIFGITYPWDPPGSTTEGTTSLSVYPEETTVYEHQAFLVDVAVTNATNLYGYEFKLYYNATVLNCTGVDFPSDHFLEPTIDPENLWIVKKEYDNAYNSTHGRVWVAVSLMADEPGKNGSGTLTTINFTATAAGKSTLNLKDTKLGDSEAEAIPVTVVDGSVTVLSIYHMRSDKHTVNGLTAYKLGATQTANSKYFMKDANGRKDVSWGIRVWKRSSDGQETEITGGSPVAIVMRTSDGGGIQSGVWSCPETSLEPTDAIVVRVYQQFGQDSWTLAAEFTTEQLDENKLDSATWTVYYYTSRSYLPGYPPYLPPTTTGCFYWGTTTYNSHIEIEPN